MITWVGGDFFDDHLGRLMIIWVRKGKPSLARQACVPKDEMIIWVCGTVGLWDCGTLAGV